MDVEVRAWITMGERAELCLQLTEGASSSSVWGPCHREAEISLLLQIFLCWETTAENGDGLSLVYGENGKESLAAEIPGDETWIREPC